MTKDGAKKIYAINITDYTSSISLKVIADKEKWRVFDTISKGKTLLVKGEVTYDKYDREIVIRPKNINSVEKVKIVDKAEKNVLNYIYIRICLQWMELPLQVI